MLIGAAGTPSRWSRASQSAVVRAREDRLQDRDQLGPALHPLHVRVEPRVGGQVRAARSPGRSPPRTSRRRRRPRGGRPSWETPGTARPTHGRSPPGPAPGRPPRSTGRCRSAGRPGRRGARGRMRAPPPCARAGTARRPPRARRTSRPPGRPSAAPSARARRPASPVRLIPPPIAWSARSKAGHSRYGPSWPKAEIEQTTSRGLRRRSVSGAHPSRAITPGRKFSQTTSATRQRSWKTSRPSGRLEVERHAPLVAVDRQEVRAVALRPEERRPHDAHGVAAARLLDLDHLGPEVGEQHRAVGPREHAGEVEHADPVEEPHRVHRAVTGSPDRPGQQRGRSSAAGQHVVGRLAGPERTPGPS